jgi:hypothetical protein
MPARRLLTRLSELATSPGEVLRELVNEYGPLLILIDEWLLLGRN